MKSFRGQVSLAKMRLPREKLTALAVSLQTLILKNVRSFKAFVYNQGTFKTRQVKENF
jgi:hypothetical protein